MGQSIEVVQEAADAVTDSVYDEGAATELDRWFRRASGTSDPGVPPPDDRDRPRSSRPTSTAPCSAPTASVSAAHGVGAARGARPRRGGRVRHGAAVAVDGRPVGLRRVARAGRRLQRRAAARRRDRRAARGPRHRPGAGPGPGRRDPVARAGLRTSRSRRWRASRWSPATASPGTRRPAAPRGDLASRVDRAGAEAPGPAPDPGSRSSSGRGCSTRWASPGDATWTVDGLMEISAVGVTKGAALARLCDAASGSRPRDVVAFGDMPNDLPMLAWAGTSYAVANAHPSVLERGRPRRPGERRRRGGLGARRRFSGCDVMCP